MNGNAANMLIAFAEIGIALAGFSGVVVAFGSRSVGKWHHGDRLRLNFLLESSLTAGAFALLTLLMLSIQPAPSAVAWVVVSILWALFMIYSLYTSHLRVEENRIKHGDIDTVSNRIVFTIFLVLILLQVANAVEWRHPAPVLAAVGFNLAASAMQFARLIRSAFHD